MPMLDFSKFKNAISMQFNKLTQHDMFVTAIEKDDMWAHYLASFPPGTNPMFRHRTEYDCACCRQFVRAVGNAVAIIDGRVESIWDAVIDESTYQTVATEMSRLVKAAPIRDAFLHGERYAGTDKTFEQGESEILRWEHFYVQIPHARNQGKNLYCSRRDMPTKLGEMRQTRDVFLRGLTELTEDAFDTVLGLIKQQSLYRGAEYEYGIDMFARTKKQFDRLCADAEQTLEQKRAIFAWSNYDKLPASVAKIRNTAIGTLLIDLSAGVDLEDAVRKFETSIMAPTNFKRPTALVSQKMVDTARSKIEELGLTSALDRRYARLADININDVLFANRDAKKAITGDAFDGIANKKKTTKNLDKIETIAIEKFITEVVPTAESIEVFLENQHEGNLVSLIAPVDPTAKQLFKWNNGFSWAYNGDVADSIRERVKRAGGSVSGDLCCRLAWYNHDDLDLHMVQPNTYEIYYGNKVCRKSGGQLDVDMNAGWGWGTTRQPVENIFYGDRRKMAEGIYTLNVHQFTQREMTDVGFEVEIDYLGSIQRFVYDKAVRGTIQVAKFEYSHASGIRMIESMPSTTASRTIWNVSTQDFHKVTVLMRSPNHWEGARGVGNKHYFFMLDGCQNDGAARGFFNEFLRDDLTPYRKVIEIVGSRMKTKETSNQLSGIGFSDTKRAEILVRVKGSFTRTLKVTI